MISWITNTDKSKIRYFILCHPERSTERSCAVEGFYLTGLEILRFAQNDMRGVYR